MIDVDLGDSATSINKNKDDSRAHYYKQAPVQVKSYLTTANKSSSSAHQKLTTTSKHKCKPRTTNNMKPSQVHTNPIGAHGRAYGGQAYGGRGTHGEPIMNVVTNECSTQNECSTLLAPSTGEVSSLLSRTTLTSVLKLASRSSKPTTHRVQERSRTWRQKQPRKLRPQLSKRF